MNGGTAEHAIRLIAGLGNPGGEYASTRHNLGFRVVTRLLEKLPKSMERVNGCSSCYWRGSYAGKKLFVQMPQTYMNLSGNAVGPLAAANGIEPEEVLIVYDDMDLPAGKLRIRPGGGCGGHNGMKSVAEALHTENFPRMRIGIGRAAHASQMADYVLSPLTAEEDEIFGKVTEAAADALILILRRGTDYAASQYNAQDYGRETEKENASVAET